jgi:hypothetical protein
MEIPQKFTWFSMGKSYQISGWWRYPHDLSETSIYRKHPYFMTKSSGRSSPGNLHGEPPKRPHTDRLRRPAPQVAPASARLMGSYLVGGCNQALWKIWISWDDDIPNWIEKYKMFQPPTRDQCSSINLQKWGYQEGYLYKIQKHSTR